MSQTKQGTTFRCDVLRLASGTAGAQALAALAAPLLTRLFTPGDYGALAVYSSLLALLSVVACLRYELAIPLPEKEQDAADLAGICLLSVGFTSVLSSGWVLVWGELACAWLGVPHLAGYLWLLPVGVLLGGLYNTFNYWSIRAKQFTTIAGTRWQQAMAAILLQLCAFKLGAPALLFGQVAGQSVGTLGLARPALRRSAFRDITGRGMWSVLRRYRRFPLFSTGEGLANTAGMQLPPLMFAAFFGASSAGIYSLTYRILQMPMALVGSAIGQVFFAHAAEARRNGTLGDLVMELHEKLVRYALPPAFALIFAGPVLFSFVFGPEWESAGVCASWLAPWLYLVFVSSPLSTLFSVMEWQDRGLAFQVLLLVVRCGAILAGAWQGDFLFALQLFAVSSALCWAGFLVWLGRAVGIAATRMIRPTLQTLITAAISTAPLWIVFLLGVASRTGVLVAGTAAGVLILGQYWRTYRNEKWHD